MQVDLTEEQIAALIGFINKRILICDEANEAVSRKRSWRDSEKAMARAKYAMEVIELKGIRQALSLTGVKSA